MICYLKLECHIVCHADHWLFHAGELISVRGVRS